MTTASSSVEHATPGRVATHHFSVTNTGEATDLIRIKAETAAGWKTQVQHNVIEVAAGETVDVPVYVEIPEGKQAPTNLVFTATSETDASKTASETNVLLNDISAAGIKALVERLQKNGDITNATAARALTTHLTAVELYEKQQAGDKVVKHMDGFTVLLDQQTKNGLLSEKASNTIKGYAALMLQK